MVNRLQDSCKKAVVRKHNVKVIPLRDYGALDKGDCGVRTNINGDV